MEQPTATTDLPWRLGKGPFVFIGTPPFCWGEVALENLSDHKVKIRTLDTAERSRKTQPVRGLDAVRVRARLSPRSASHKPAYFDVDPHTPPGTYKTEIVRGDQREPAVIHVLENPDFAVSPSRVVLRGRGGERLTQVLVVRNHGNIPHRMHEAARIWLEEEDWVGRTFVYALRDKAENVEGHQAFLDRVLGEFSRSMIHQVRVSLTCDDPDIRPGDTREVSLGLTLPEHLRKGRVYFGFIRLMGKRLWIEVRCLH